jgi:hypothetical protein
MKQEVRWMAIHTILRPPNLTGRNLFKDLNTDERLILKRIIKKQDGRM